MKVPLILGLINLNDEFKKEKIKNIFSLINRQIILLFLQSLNSE